MTRTFSLPLWPYFFDSIKTGVLTFLPWVYDRDFRIGDILILKETDEDGSFTGREIPVKVGFILIGERYGVAKGYCVMGIERMN